MKYDELFKQATGFPNPYPYQRRLALTADLPELLNIPTGLGKTEAVVLAWLWRRRFDPREEVRQNTPRRLVYCLPMRVLVEQSHERVIGMMGNLGLLAMSPGDDNRSDGWAAKHGDTGGRIAVSLLMGGEDADDWDLYPEREAVLVGTQDMLLSRALNRGYAMSRYRWPVHFGLLNNDCLWVMDEVQLMGVGLATSAQLAGVRSGLKTWLKCPTLWMSATPDPTQLATVDHAAPSPGTIWGLDPEDLADERVRLLRGASKEIRILEDVDPSGKSYPRVLASRVAELHRPGKLTLVVVNVVERARRIFGELGKLSLGDVELRLVHSRFRPAERRHWQDEFLSRDARLPTGGRIVVATQVVEAGVDLSATSLVTEAAPWASLVQRFGRCNRRGEFGSGEAVAAIVPMGEQTAAPYGWEEVSVGLETVRDLRDAGIEHLSKVQPRSTSAEFQTVIRRKDIVELFDTTPDLAGDDVDVSRYIRESQDIDVQFFWRAEGPNPDGRLSRGPARDELCPVAIGEARDFLKKSAGEHRSQVWVFNALESRWARAHPAQLRPGQALLLLVVAGGYSVETGFDPSAKGAVAEVLPPDLGLDVHDQEGYDEDTYAEGAFQTIAEHTDAVVATVERLARSLGLPKEIADLLMQAARWHDRGKAHEVFQKRVPSERRPEALRDTRDLAKAPSKLWTSGYERPHFRHEVASALAALAAGLTDLAAYLVASHHGKVRLSLRSMPGESFPADAGSRFCRGVWDGDRLPATGLGGGMLAPEVTLSLDPMEIGLSPQGKPSWTELAIALRHEPGPFRLAFLEAVLRTADRLASMAGRQGPAQHA